MTGEAPEPEDSEYPGHTAAFARLVKTTANAQPTVRSMAPFTADLALLTNEELVLLSQVGRFSHLMVAQEAIAAEVAGRTVGALHRNENAVDRSTAALVEFKEQSRIASDRLESLTKWLVAFTIAVVVLTVVLVARDLTR